jgi:hypothetical protein
MSCQYYRIRILCIKTPAAPARRPAAGGADGAVLSAASSDQRKPQ